MTSQDIDKSIDIETVSDTEILGIKAGIEAVLFAAGDPIHVDKLAAIVELDRERLNSYMALLMKEYEQNPGRGLIIRKLDDFYTLSTKPGVHEYIQRMFLPRNRPPMSQAAYETLAIIAYNQPVTRSQVEFVRGVSSDGIISRLLQRDLIVELGTLDAPGRPSLFGTSQLFLREFGLSSLNDLPPMDMLMYESIREIEQSASERFGTSIDSQITIDQLSDVFDPFFTETSELTPATGSDSGFAAEVSESSEPASVVDSDFSLTAETLETSEPAPVVASDPSLTAETSETSEPAPVVASDPLVPIDIDKADTTELNGVFEVGEAKVDASDDVYQVSEAKVDAVDDNLELDNGVLEEEDGSLENNEELDSSKILDISQAFFGDDL